MWVMDVDTGGNLLVLVILGLAVLCLVLGFVFGFIRGVKRSIIRIVLIVLCGVGAFFLKGVFVNLLQNIQIDGQTIEEFLLNSLNLKDVSSATLEIIDNIISIALGLVGYFLIFFILQFVTWCLFPLLKLIFCRGNQYMVKKRRLFGALIGLGQGILIAFFICVPLNGLLVQAGELVSIELNGEPVLECPENIDPAAYKGSVAENILTKSGGWYFKLITSTKDSNNETICLEDAIVAISSSVKLGNEVQNLGETIKNIDLSNGLNSASAQEIQDIFYKMDEICNNMTDKSKEIISTVINDMATALGGDSISDFIPEDFDVTEVNFGALGDVVSTVAQVSENKEIDNDKAATIVNGFVKNEIIVNAMEDYLGEDCLLKDMDGDQKQCVKDAINNSEGSAELKNKLQKLLLGAA